MNDTKTVIACDKLSKTYTDGDLNVDVLDNIQFSVNAGEQVAIVGASGTGKSTLLHLLGGLDKPSAGEVSLLGQDIWALSEKKRCRLRNQHLGFVYQFHHLLPEFTALENVMMPLLIGDDSVCDAKEKASVLLSDVGLAKRLLHKPSQLSGGERQRVAIARALINRPACVLADEPTGNLDEETANGVFELFLKLNERHQTAFVTVTHNLSLAHRMDRTLYLTAQGLEVRESV